MITKEEVMTETAPSGNRKKKIAAAASAAGVLSVGAALTLASWTDWATVDAEFQAGQFDVEISTDGGTTWQSEASLGFADLGDDLTWAPGDQHQVDFSLRLAPGTTHDGVISADGGFELETTGAIDYVHSISDSDAKPVAGGDSLDSLAADRDIELPATGEAQDFSLSIVAGQELSQGSHAEATWEFTAEQQEGANPDAVEQGDEEPEED